MKSVIDPVCGMRVDADTTTLKSTYQGKTHYFCAPGCKKAFDNEPERYLSQASGEDSHAHHGGHHSH